MDFNLKISYNVKGSEIFLRYCLPKIVEKSKGYREKYLGVTGVSDASEKTGLGYGHRKSLVINNIKVQIN